MRAVMAGGSTSSPSHFHHTHSRGPRGSASSSSSSVFSTTGLFKTSGKLASVKTTVSKRIPSYIPGFKTSATFLTSLSANLRIPDDAVLPSPMSTPASVRAVDSIPSHHYPPVSPLIAAMSSDDIDSIKSSAGLLTPASSSDDLPKPDPLEGVPPLNMFVVTTAPDRIEALKLIADSVAQQRQVASKILISNPFNIAIFGLILAIVGKFIYKEQGDWALLFTTYMGIAMASLILVRWVVAPYLKQAEALDWNWLGDDAILATRYGDRIIGALVLGWDTSSHDKARGKKRKCVGKGMIRAWTVLLKYRGTGEGRALLEETVQFVQRKGGDGLEFADDNIHSTRVLPGVYNGTFDRRDQRARQCLDKVIRKHGNFSKRR